MPPTHTHNEPAYDGQALQQRRTVVITANPYSGAGRNAVHVEQLQQALHAAGMRTQVLWDTDERLARFHESAFMADCRCVVVGGGDGSLTDVLNDLDAAGHLKDVPVAALPMGNENLFARQFGYSRDAQAMTKILTSGNARPLDLGRCNGRLFHLMASAGFDADVVHRMQHWRQQDDKLRRVNRLRYVPRTISTVLRYDYPMMMVDTGEQRIHAAQVFVFNQPQYAARTPLCRAADPHDGLLDYVTFNSPGLLRFGWYAIHAWLGRHLQRGDVSHGRATQLTIASDKPVPMQIDGDPHEHTPATITIEPAVARVMNAEAHGVTPWASRS